MIAVLGVSACTSDPSAQRVAEDIVRTVAQDFPDIEECMLGVIDDYDLNDLGDKANSDNPEISRLRCGNMPLRGPASGANSLITAPAAAIASASRACSLG